LIKENQNFEVIHETLVSIFIIQGVPKIQVDRPPFDGRGQNNTIRPNSVMPKVNRGGDRRRKVKIGLNFKLDLQGNQLT